MGDFGRQPLMQSAMVSAADAQMNAQTTDRRPVDRLEIRRLCVGCLLYCPQVVPWSTVHSARISYAVVVGVKGGGLRARRGSKMPSVA